MKDIQNDELRGKIVSYYALAEHLIEDYTSDYAYSERLQNLQDNILNFNYPDREEMRIELFELLEVPRERWNDIPAYRKAQSLNYDLLTEDKTEIIAMINTSFRYKYLLLARFVANCPV